MKIIVSNYVDLTSMYALFGIDGYYLKPIVIIKMIVDELNIGMTYNDIKNFINTCESLKEEKTLIKYLDKIQNKTITKEEIEKANINLNQYGDIYIEDALKLVEKITNNVRKAYKKQNKVKIKKNDV